MQIRIKVIIPNSGMSRETLDAREQMLASALSPETLLSVDCISRGPASIESNTDEALAAVEVIQSVRRAEKDGFDAVVIYCFSDLALDSARENVDIPVIGPGEITLHIAEMLSNRYTVVTTVDKNVGRTYSRLKGDAGLSEKLAAVRALNIPVEGLREDYKITMECLENVCREAVDQDGADTVVLGCLGMAGYGAALEETYGITVLDPAFVAVSYAEMCARTGIRHNRRVYGKFERGGELD